MRTILVALLLVCASTVYGQDAKLLQDLSVTVNAGGAQGSGVIITRDLALSKTDATKVKANFVLTAAHVVDGLRSVTEVVDPSTGTSKKVIQYGDAQIVKEFNEDGRKVGETRLLAKVVAYSDADNREDVALLLLYKKNAFEVNTDFYLGKDIPEVGTPLLHVGSLLGQFGSGSLTSGIVSQVGRVLNLNGNNGIVFDQTTAPAFPGSSGGGLFIASGPNKNQYVGMVVRQADPTFNFYSPIRRIKAYTDKKGLNWVVDKSVVPPSLEEILSKPIDDVKVSSDSSARSDVKSMSLKFLIKRDEINADPQL